MNFIGIGFGDALHGQYQAVSMPEKRYGVLGNMASTPKVNSSISLTVGSRQSKAAEPFVRLAGNKWLMLKIFPGTLLIQNPGVYS